MLFFILGVRTTKIKAKPLKGKTVCVKCNSVESFKLGGTANYFHLFWIPLIPLGKFEEFICTKCGKHHYKKTAPKDLLSNLENQPLKRPKWHFLGIGLIFIWFLSGSVFALIFNVKDSISNNERHKVLEAEKALFVKDLSQAKFNPSFETDSIAFQINNNLDFKKYGVNNSNIAYKTQIRGNKLLVILNIKGGKKLKYENLLPLHKSIEDFVIITYKGKLIKPYVVFYDEDKLLYVDTSKMNHYFESDGNPVMDFYDDNDIVDIERRKELEYKTQLLHAYRENRISSVKMDTAKISLIWKKISEKYRFRFHQKPIDVTKPILLYDTRELFPNELKVLLKHHNGEGPFLNSDMIITEVYKLNRLFNEMAYKQLSNEKYIDKLNKILPVAYSPQWYPFYNDMTYTYAIDLLPGKNGDMGQVILLGKDEEPSTFVAKDLETFLELYLNKKVKMDVSSWQ